MWFTNTPSLAASFLNLPTIGGGWMSALEEKMTNATDIELGVAFRHGTGERKTFNNKRTTYFTIPDNRTKSRLLLNSHLNRLDDEQLLADCVQIVNEFKPDVINVFGTEDAFGLIAERVNIPVVIHLQGILTVYELKWFAANLHPLDLVRNSSWKSFLKAESLLHTYKHFQKASGREKQIFQKGKYFLGRTDWDRRITSVLAPAARYFQSEEMLRKEFYKAAWNKTPATNKVLLSTIQANIYKGLETIFEAATLLKANNRFPFQWQVAGIPADSVIVRIFEKKSGKAFRDLNVVFLGKLEVNDLLQKERNADIFIHPSHIDNSPNSVCEAMLLGMPVVATFAGGTGSLLTDRKEGLLIQDGDPYAMAGAILELLNDPGFAAMLGRNARERALHRHNPEAIVNNLLSIYAEVTGKPAFTPAETRIVDRENYLVTAELPGKEKEREYEDQ